MKQKKTILVTLVLVLIFAWYFIPVWWGGYSGFRVYKIVEFIEVIFPRGVIAVQARQGRDLSKLKDQDEKPKDLKVAIVERGLPSATIYGLEWKVTFDSKRGETTLHYPLSPKTTPEFEKVRLEVLSKLKAISKTHEFIKQVMWDGQFIVVTYKTLGIGTK